ncbi:hypothetical protein ACTWPB_07535 [Nocardia sp. IBHARD005]|uniref:hypothetical protein n=1 Tax=Nocardia sp. IBHARD005 TaxID=3457765 RepID=UPI0040586C2C
MAVAPEADCLYLSRLEQKDIVAKLRDIRTWLLPELDTVITRQTSYGTPNTTPTRKPGRTEQPLPYHQAAADVATDLYGTLRSWVEHVCNNRHRPWPGDLRADGYARWLDRNIIDLALCQEAPDAADEILDAYKRAVRVIDLPKTHTYQGGCEVCGGDLWAVRGESEITCGQCAGMVNRSDNDARIDRELEIRNYTASELVAIARDRLGVTIKPKTVHDMGYRKTNPVLVRGHTYDQQNLYNAGDVLRELRRRAVG